MAYYIYLSNRQRSRVIKMLALLVGMIVVGYLIFLYVPALAVFIQRFGDAAESGDVTLGRTAFWTLAIEEFKDAYKRQSLGSQMSRSTSPEK